MGRRRRRLIKKDINTIIFTYLYFLTSLSHFLSPFSFSLKHYIIFLILCVYLFSIFFFLILPKVVFFLSFFFVNLSFFIAFLVFFFSLIHPTFIYVLFSFILFSVNLLYFYRLSTSFSLTMKFHGGELVYGAGLEGGASLGRGGAGRSGAGYLVLITGRCKLAGS